MFEVHGGVWTDMSFKDIVWGTEEYYGPFETREEAVAVWRGKMGVNIDICEHRLFVTEYTSVFRDDAPDMMMPQPTGISVCDRCGREWPSAPAGHIHKCQCTGGYCYPKKESLQ